MSGIDPQEEIGRLAAELCDGHVTPEQAARLEELVGRSEDARRYLANYLKLHGELCWDAAGSAGHRALSELIPTVAPKHGGRRTLHRVGWWVIAATAASVLFVLGSWAVLRWRTVPSEPTSASELQSVAQVTGEFEARWSDDDAGAFVADRLTAGQRLELESGLVEVTFRSGARAILEGPTVFRIESADQSYLAAGDLTAFVPSEARGFTVHTPTVSVVDRGTQFGVAVDNSGHSEVHVFDGLVEVRADRTSVSEPIQRQLVAGQAVRVSRTRNGRTTFHDIASGSRTFVLSLPVRPSVARLRALVAEDPNLIHHYTFEGVNRLERCQDRKGTLHLTQVVMRGGRDGGTVDLSAIGFDGVSGAMRPFRSELDGNTNGVGLQSEAAFLPPQAMTLELLLRFDGFPVSGGNEIGVAIGTRADRRDCGFYVVAVDRGELTFLMDADASWGTSGVNLVPGEWYYVGATFQAESGQTTVNVYLANLTRGERELSWTVRNETVAGSPSSSRLGIGKGFDEHVAHAYPWSGALDEVAVYDAALDRHALEKHHQALFGMR